MDIFDTIVDMYGEIDDDGETMDQGIERPDLSNINDGDEFEFRGIRFIRLGMEQGGILCITKNSMFYSRFNNGNDNNYNNSLIREKIRQEFLSRMEGVELLPFTMDLRAENGETDYGSCTDDAGLITTDLYRKYHYQIPTNNEPMWTCTPFSCMENYPYVEYVTSSGNVNYNYASSSYRCRPACIFPI